jgi:hypothetical protein
MAAEKLTDNDRRLIEARVGNGETMAELAKEYGVASSTIKKAVEKVQAGKVPAPGMPPVTITEFRSRARKILWRLNSGKEKIQYNRWAAMVEELHKNGKMSEPQAVVQASKSFDALKPLFATCDVSALDPHPGSHADIVHYRRDSDRPTIRCLNKVISVKEQLAWAAEAAGRYAGDGIEPDECPNWASYMLYQQARSDPGNFAGKYIQAGMRAGEDEDEESTRKSGKRSIKEINEMLELLKPEPEGEET